MTSDSPASQLQRLLDDRSAHVAIIGLGYVGLPLAMAVARGGFRVTGFDVDDTKPGLLNAGTSYIGAVADIERAVASEDADGKSIEVVAGEEGADVHMWTEY